MSPFKFNTTSSIVFGANTLQQLGTLALDHMGKRIALITDAGLVKTGMVAQAVASLESQGIACAVFDGVLADPAEHIILDAVEKMRQFGATAVVGIGGGSSLDVAKLVAILLAGEQKLESLYGINQVTGSRLPLLLIPTTAGTGSEVTPISIITTGSHEKKGVVSPKLLPDIALLDPILTLGLPPHVTAATGVDAMVHAIESYTSVNANNNPISKGLAIQALVLLSKNIRTAVKEPGNVEARSGMLLGSMLAGQAFANSPVAAVHALAYPLGGHYGIPHGLSNALMLPQVLRFNAKACAESYAELAPYIVPALQPGSVESLCEQLILSIESLITAIGLPNRLKDMNIPESACSDLASDAMKQARLLVNNPREVTLGDALHMYQTAW